MILKRLGFNLHDESNNKVRTTLGAIKNAFEGEYMKTQCSVSGYKINNYFHDNKLEIEVHECGLSDRKIDDEIKRQKAIEK